MCDGQPSRLRHKDSEQSFGTLFYGGGTYTRCLGKDSDQVGESWIMVRFFVLGIPPMPALDSPPLSVEWAEWEGQTCHADVLSGLGTKSRSL